MTLCVHKRTNVWPSQLGTIAIVFRTVVHCVTITCVHAGPGQASDHSSSIIYSIMYSHM